MSALTPAPHRAKPHVQTPAEKQLVYDYVTARDVTCRAPAIDPVALSGPVATGESSRDCSFFDPRTGRWENRPLERHHAGNTIGSKRITDARHVVLLCKWHHANWAPSHSRLILDYLKDVEDAREKARHDFEEDARAELAVDDMDRVVAEAKADPAFAESVFLDGVEHARQVAEEDGVPA